MTKGFKGFAKPQKIDNDQANHLVGNLADDEYVVYTGGNYSRRRASGRSNSLATVKEVMTPVPLREYAQRAIKEGYNTSISVGGLGLHQGAKPAVYLHLVKDEKGNFRAKKDIPTPDRSLSEKPFAAGDIVIPASQGKAVAKAKTTATKK